MTNVAVLKSYNNKVLSLFLDSFSNLEQESGHRCVQYHRIRALFRALACGLTLLVYSFRIYLDLNSFW